MSTKYVQFCQAVLTGAAAQVYGPMPGNTTGAIHAASAWNPAGAAAPVAVDVFLVPASGAAGDANHVARVMVAPGESETLIDLINQKIQAGMSIEASGAGVTLTVSGVTSV
ncbi:hypothetical protein BM43_474 [Burkholderia gladioli]|uniref:Uncharacterized protein n=2 Tax=Burkholderia gladioli TaxID=28095 RepID=A0AAW3F8J6_BURGA|nr:hypothetical protein [Burkholderia gladioli]AJW97273.1 hypothetical protein BM43_474 [Burkholderia gladioli]KGC17673.1 hypothetical protein DM48_5170 [Burkholderia gladioli]SPU83224.1 Uncharacterised protein [Burkholderia gladioli]